MLTRCLFAATTVLIISSPASAQFYKDKTLTLLVNYAAGGNADTEARVVQRHLAKYIAGPPTVIIRNVAGAGGANAMNQLGLNVGSQPDGAYGRLLHHERHLDHHRRSGAQDQGR
jgi:tripartite-type tricarboxylate transporter receptor subunit TctC